MKQSRSTPCTEQRLARFITWARLMLGWIAMLMVSTGFKPDPRRLRRYGHLSLDRLARMVRNLIIIRACQIMPAPRLRAPPRRNVAPAGFTRRLERRQFLRSFAGSRLRRALRARDPATRISVLLAALRDIDVLARLVKRRLTRLRPVQPTEPPHDALRTLAIHAPCAADSSQLLFEPLIFSPRRTLFAAGAGARSIETRRRENPAPLRAPHCAPARR